MKTLDPSVQRERWLRRTLCRRYAAVVFSTFSAPPLKGQQAENRAICWAFGSLIRGECEILGAWNLNGETATMPAVFGDLSDRGVEFVRCGLGDLRGAEAAFLATFRMSALYPSIEQDLASALSSVKPRHRAAMSSEMRSMLGEPSGVPATVLQPGISSEGLRQKYPGILERWSGSVAAFRQLFALPEPYRQLVRSVDRTAIGMQQRLMKAISRHGPFVDSVEAFDFVVDGLLRADLQLRREAEAKQLAREALVLQSGRYAPVSGGAYGAPVLA
ncbi:transposase [Roseateles sp. BYS78W]|uniref:Transposase n=1 Tax=Pelomonas candidula TaxID=3299025 RepID=A0ABW7HJE2_9BURK